MDPTADPDALNAAARAVRRQADLLDGDGSQIEAYRRQAAGAIWQGQAADRFRTVVNTTRDRARGLGGDLRAIASMIEAGADQIRRYRAEQARLEQQDRERGRATAARAY